METAQAAVTDYSVCSAQGPKGAHLDLPPPRPHHITHFTTPQARRPKPKTHSFAFPDGEDTDCNVYDKIHVGKGVENEKVSFLTAI